MTTQFSMASAQPDSDQPAARKPRAFVTTHWSVVVRAGNAGSPDGRAALEKLCRAYWYPLYWFSRNGGLSQHDAEDLVQAFFEDLLERGAIARADANRGRFRTFMVAALKNFHSKRRASASRLKRGGDRAFVSLDAVESAEERFRHEVVTELSPEKLYDQKWAHSLLDAVLARLRRDYAAAGKQPLFDELKVVLWGGRGEVSYAEIAHRLASTEGAVKVAVHRLRQRFNECVRTEIAQTVLDPAEIDEEMRHLLAAVSP